MRIWINSTLKAIKATIVASRILCKAMMVAFSTEPVNGHHKDWLTYLVELAGLVNSV